MPEQMRLISKLKEMMPKSPDVQDALDTLEEEALKSYENKGDGEMPEHSGDEDMGLELSMDDQDLGGESNPTDIMSAEEEETGPEANEGSSKEEDEDLKMLRKMSAKKKK